MGVGVDVKVAVGGAGVVGTRIGSGVLVIEQAANNTNIRSNGHRKERTKEGMQVIIKEAEWGVKSSS